MEQNIRQLITEGKYDEVTKIAEGYLNNYDLDEAEYIYNELYDRIVDEEGRDSENAVYLLRMLAITNFEKGKYDEALSMNNSVLEWYDRHNLLKSEMAIHTMISIATIYEMYNRFDDEYELCKKALAISLDSFGEKAIVSCSVLRVLADCCVSLGKYDEGISYYERLLRVYWENEETDADDIAMVYDGLGYAYRYKGMPQKAKECFEAGIDLLKHNSKDSETLLLMLNDLCNLYYVLSMLEEALELRKTILERTEKLYGFEHPNVIVSKSNLADAYENLGDYCTAIRLYEECCQWNYDNLGPLHRETIRNKTRLSSVYNKVGRFEEALKLAEEVYRSRCDLLGEDHVDSIIALENIAFCYIEMKNFRNAKEIFARTKKYFKDNYGETPDYYYSSENYLYACAYLGDYSEVIDNADRLLELNKTFSEPADTDNMMCVKAMTYRGMKRFAEAEECQKEHINYAIKKYGEEHPETLKGKYDLAYILFDKGDLRAAFELCREIVSIQERTNAVYIDILKSKTLLSRIYSALDLYDKASEILNIVLDNKETLKYRPEYADACYAAAENCSNMKQYEKAKEYAEKSFELRRSIYEEDYIDIRKTQELCDKIRKECV